jgi:hypothetical protein
MSQNATPTIVEFVEDAQLLGLSISPAQRALLKAIYGLPLDAEEHELWGECTGRPVYPSQPFGEVTVIAGARAGKDSRIACPVALYEALFGGHEAHLAKGERAVIPVVAQDQRATRVAFGYLRDYLTGSSLLAPLVEEMLSLEVRLTNGVTLLCFPCTLRSLRGFSMPAGIMDELAFFRLEGQADSDVEVQASIRRGMLAFPSPRLVKVSTPYMKGGVLFDDFRRAWGTDDPDLLVWKAGTVRMNPTLTASRLARERRLDPARYAREYEAEFAEDLEAFLSERWLDACIDHGVFERARQDGRWYVGTVDPSGGSDRDRFTATVVHVEGDGPISVVVQDAVRGWRGSRGETVNLEAVVRDAVAMFASYGIKEVCGDRYAGQWVRQAFERWGISYRDAPWDRSAAYLELEPLVAQGRVRLLDVPEQTRELRLLERRPRAGGRTVVDHPAGAHDDLANVLALGAAWALGAAEPATWDLT